MRLNETNFQIKYADEEQSFFVYGRGRMFHHRIPDKASFFVSCALFL